MSCSPLPMMTPPSGLAGRTAAPADDDRLTRLAMVARDGRPDDVEAFVRAVYGDVRRFAAYLAGIPAAEDLTQETFLRVLGSLPGFAGRSSARTWLLSIVRRVVVDRFRAAAVRPVVAELPDWQAAAERCQPRDVPGPEEGVALADLLLQLPFERREAFVLTQVSRLSYAEAAELIGCPVGTVRSRVARARGQLVEALLAADQAA
ncbi:RNA polymerase sigma factor [Sphaerisporangium krabiense]|uniref:RNA polymerase sigma factor n=1 Tax=Sphaerisporangium krabiense TaxID=763782 RepID=A0A7W8Z1Q4_9ACTN|nr:sigma-70 family RNA polymerase sigma factor [Sphaerisporangium krabiense]MBB5625863.1 RNA polymerase sigma-70 factor (ECF subfamily) [Sphaerisporangium krabiense]GII64666.1 RNA polymerase sigma factor [Sphaerisporangium krabiense]